MGAKFALLMSAVAAIGFSFAPTAEATPVTYEFTIHYQPAGPLTGDATGTFSFDSGSIVAGGTNKATGLLTALDFTFNGVIFDASMVNTGLLTFNAAGELTDFLFGTSCSAGKCAVAAGNSWFLNSPSFAYTIVNGKKAGSAKLTSFSLVTAPPPVRVPEPGTLGLFGLGALMIGLFVGVRRRRMG